MAAKSQFYQEKELINSMKESHIYIADEASTVNQLTQGFHAWLLNMQIKQCTYYLYEM